MSGSPGFVCRTAPSCTLLPTPMLTVSPLSPRSVAPNHTVLRSASTTLPMIEALGATYALIAILGETSPNRYKAIYPPPFAAAVKHTAQRGALIAALLSSSIIMIDTPTNADYPPQGWLTALARLWLLKPVRSTPSGDPQGAILIMAAVWLLAWVAIDRWQSQPDPQFFPNGIPLLAWYALAILGLAALLRRWARPAPALGPALALAMGVVPAPLFFTGVAAAYLDPSWYLDGGLVV